MMSASASNGRHILIAGHDPSLGNVLAAVLQTEHYHTDVAYTLEDALAKVSNSLYDLVLTDLFITHPPILMNAAQRLQKSCGPTPVGILTTWPVNPDEAKRNGFAFVLFPPFDIDILLEQIADAGAAGTAEGIPPRIERASSA